MQQTPKAGIVVAAAIGIFVLAALAALLSHAPSLQLEQIWGDPYYRHVTRFSFYQALLSTLLSVSLALPLALALFRRRFPGRQLLLRLFSSTLVLPVLVAVFGLLAVYGNSGLLANVCGWFDARLPFSVYGLSGILLAHVFFNLPYSARLLLQSLEGIPPEQHKLCTHLGMNHWQKFRWVEWPQLRQQLPHIAGLVFMLCFTSFATVMALGGGPKATTIELAVYQAIKFDFDLQAGALLAIWQMLLCGLLYLSLARLARGRTLQANYRDAFVPALRDSFLARCWDWSWIALSLLLVLPPLVMVLLSGLNPQSLRVLADVQFWQALQSSLCVALLAASLATLAGCAILLTSRSWRLQRRSQAADRLELVGSIILVTPGLVVSTGLFLLLRHLGDAYSFAFIIVVLVNGVMALPYVLKTLAQPMYQLAQQYQMLCASLGMRGLARLRLVEWRALRRPLSHAFALGFMVSVGDISAIALFGSQDFRTLPLYLYQLLGSYQMEAAAVVALCLLLLSVGVFTLTEKLYKWIGGADAAP